MNYKRLTSKTHTYTACEQCTYRKCQFCDNISSHKKEIYNRLVELEDKIENGTFVDLPCKVGDTIYEVFKNHIPPFIQQTKVEKIIITEKGLRLKLARNSMYETSIASFGKTLFLTEAEALKNLKSKTNIK